MAHLTISLAQFHLELREVEMRMRGRRVMGLTLLEMLVCLVIVATLATVAWPAYQAQQLRARRSDGQALLMRMHLAQQQRWVHQGRYAQQPQELGTLGRSQMGHYRLELQGVSESGYTLLAHPVDAQAQDLECGSLRLSWQDQRTLSLGTLARSPAPECWPGSAP
jgi:type IV pilus assembly protein PilE